MDGEDINSDSSESDSDSELESETENCVGEENQDEPLGSDDDLDDETTDTVFDTGKNGVHIFGRLFEKHISAENIHQLPVLGIYRS